MQAQASQKWGFNTSGNPTNNTNSPAAPPSAAATRSTQPSVPPTPPPPPTPSATPSASSPVANTPPNPQPVSAEIPTETILAVQTIDRIDSSTNHTGDQFHASLAEAIVIGTQVVIPKNADVRLRLAEAKSAGHFTGKSELQIELIAIDYQGKSFPVVSEPYEVSGSSRGKRSAETIGGGAILGAVIGGILGGGKGAAIGAGAGAGGGTTVQILTKGKRVRVPSETRIEFRLRQPVAITYIPASSPK